MDPVARTLEKARQDLLDLGMRNTLLNYRELRSRGLRITGPEPAEIFETLIADEETTAAFAPHPEDAAGLASTSARADIFLETPYSSKDLERRLRNTYYSARSVVEEQGVNVLFLALGMLEWFEDDSSEELRRAPLILIPVRLSRADVQANFTLEYTGEEIRTNRPLEVKLDREFRIELPEFAEDDEEADVHRYLVETADAILHRPRWKVDTTAVALGFFSFHKLLMYEDLDEDKWPEEAKPSKHPILRCLLQDGFSDSSPVVSDGDNLDEKTDPSSLYQICDADSSQTVALLEAAGGRNLVIQGPPGTGKSQTITNLIAASVAAGKTVLFVSEKMAALDVVKRRLDSYRLGAACLELHSHKTNKRAFLAELKRTLKDRYASGGGERPSVEELKQARDNLNQYCRALHEPVGETGVTPYHAFGALALIRHRLDGLDTPALDDLPLDEWTGSDYERRRDAVRRLQELVAEIGVPERHPFWGSRKKLFPPGEKAELERTSRRASERLDALLVPSRKLAGLLGAEAPNDLDSLDRWLAASRHLLDAPPTDGAAIDSAEWTARYAEIQRACSAGRELREIHARHDSHLRPEAWRVDFPEIWQILFEYDPAWWRFLSGRYRTARRKLRAWCRPGFKPSRQEGLAIAGAVVEAQRLDSELAAAGEWMRALFGPFWKGPESDWDTLEAIAAYLNATHRRIETGELPRETIAVLGDRAKRATLPEFYREAAQAREAFVEAAGAAFNLVELDQPVRFGPPGFARTPYGSLRSLFDSWGSNAARLQEMVTFNHCSLEAEKLGFSPVVQAAASWEKAGAHLLDLVHQAWNENVLNRAFRERPVLAAFDGRLHEREVARFRSLDERLFSLTREYIAAKHLASLHGLDDVGQVRILNHEFQKKSHHRPIRRLMIQAGYAIQTIKPVFMMSPLSVAAYLPPESVQFDLVIFDEASQVRPADALGAIIRGGQAVVVGDSRQLPPTRFFDKIGLREEDEEEFEDWDLPVSDVESILDLFAAQGSREVMLRWHYRSRHHSLIAVSNDEFYENKLVVFPAPEFRSETPSEDGRRELGLFFRYLPDAAYEPGKAVNDAEAEEVARAVMEHARKRPGLTLGVASFSMAQMTAIQDKLELLRRRRPELERFFADHSGEPFFVKNLENVQGDERDVIFISVGYGCTKEGYLSMNFGPLNHDGGERRLNVLITRARRRCEVFSNIRADDIDLARTTARGVVALKKFLRYAETGVLDVARPAAGEPESPFEAAVAEALRKHGFEIHHQVGSAGFRLDLAIVDPARPGRYLLGIECDGATYHSARWARDRDRLRQKVLENLGWRIHRIWSTDWFRDPERQLQRVLEAVEQAKAAAGAGPATSPQEPDERSTEVRDAGPQPPPPPPPPASGAQPYRTARLTLSLQGAELHEVSPTRLARCLAEVVAVESPVHVLEAAARIAGAAGVKRVGRRIREAIDRAVWRAEANGSLVRRGDFLWSRDMDKPPVRDRSALDGASRQIERIAPEEIGEAVLQIVEKAVAVSPGEAAAEACRLLGYARVTEALEGHVRGIIDRLIHEGRLRSTNGFLRLP